MISLTLTVNQALLLLIARQPFNATRDELKKLFFTGAKNEDAKKRLQIHLQDKTLIGYTVTHDPRTVNEDPVRRYFETHLALETLKDTIQKIKMDDLQKHYHLLHLLAPIILKLPKNEIYKRMADVFYGNGVHFDDSIDTEYHDEIAKLRRNQYHCRITEIERQKIILLLMCSYLCSSNMPAHNILPINIYHQGLFSPEQRGRIKKEMQENVHSQHAGVLRSYMPLPRNDTAFLSKASPYSKPADRFNPDFNSAWAKQLFSQWVHPFSCSISGTLLINLRYAKYFSNHGLLAFDNSEKMANFIKVLVSALLCKSGGHSLYEFLYPLTLPEAKDAFSFMPEFAETTMEKLFLETNNRAFEKALRDTLMYNQQLLQKKNMHAELLATFGVFKKRNHATASTPSEYPLCQAYLWPLRKVDR